MGVVRERQTGEQRQREREVDMLWKDGSISLKLLSEHVSFFFFSFIFIS